MNTGQLKWFLVLSVTVHAVALVIWTPPATDAGNPGRVINLEMVEMAGDMTAIPTDSVAETAPEPAETMPEPAETAREIPTRTTKTAAAPPARRPESGAIETIDHLTDSSATANHNPPAGVAASSQEHSRQESDRHLRDSILELVATNLKYPPLARRKGWQGIVILELHIESNGRISRLQVNETSGYPVLDRAAMESLQLASVPRAGEWLHGKPVDIMVPVEYRLVDS